MYRPPARNRTTSPCFFAARRNSSTGRPVLSRNARLLPNKGRPGTTGGTFADVVETGFIVICLSWKSTEPSVSDAGCALDLRVGEDIRFVPAAGGKFGHHRAFVPSLEPVRRVRHQGVLIAGRQDDLMPDVVSF